jgi:predicted permease
MNRVRAFWARAAGLFRKETSDGEFAAELDSHVEMHTEENLRAGMTPREARREALMRLGGMEQTKQSYRERRGLPGLETLVEDARFALRLLRNNPGFAAVAVLTLALGIGANTAIFSVVNTVLLHPLPYANPGNLVRLSNMYPPQWQELGLSPGDFQDFKAQATSFSEMAAYVDVQQGFNLTGHGDPQRVDTAYATSDFFTMLGTRPAAGQFFSADQDKPGNAPVVVISYDEWKNSFGGDPDAIGQTVDLDGLGYALIGVLPEDFHSVARADIWMPVGQYNDDLNGRVHHPFRTIARLKPGATIAQAQAEMDALNRQVGETFADTHKNWGVSVKQMEDPAAEQLRTALVVLLGAVTLVLVIACANIVNLLLARNAARRKEIGLRIALGAGRWRLLRQLLTESTLLALMGGAIGVALAGAGLNALRMFVPADLAMVKQAGLDGRVLGFTTAVCVLSGILCGAIPAVATLRADLYGVMKETGKTTGATAGRGLRSFLVVSEIALSLAPLIGAGLLIRSLDRLLEVSPGFRTDHALTMKVTRPAMPASVFNKLTQDQLNDLARKQSLQFEQMADAIAALPGVERVGGVNVLPLGSAMVSASRFLIEGQPVPAVGARPSAEVRSASLGYFSAMGIPLVRGRLFENGDWTQPNIVINQAMARKFWGDRDPTGNRINLCSLAPQPCWFSIVGVVGDVHEYGLDKGDTFDVYGAGGWTPYFVIRTAADPSLVALAATEQIHKIDPSLPVTQVMTLDDRLDGTVAARRFSTVLLGIFATLALLLAALGIYGVMSYVVSLRTSEIGIRMALGAQPRDVWRLIIGRAAALALTGVAIGLAGTFAFRRVISGMLFGVRAQDPLTLASVSALLMLVALAACWLPTRRAMRVDPMVALRHE